MIIGNCIQVSRVGGPAYEKDQAGVRRNWIESHPVSGAQELTIREIGVGRGRGG